MEYINYWLNTGQPDNKKNSNNSLDLILKTFSKIFTLLRLISIWEWRTICTYFITSFYFYKIILANPIKYNHKL